MPAPDPARARAIADRLIRIPSVGPDVAAETACARAVADSLPAGVISGEWLTGDGRPAIWALVRGRSPRTVVMLGHYDTVDVAEYEALGDPAGAAIACDPQALLARLQALARDPGFELPAAVRADLDAERAAPGTWVFGRGALDMKSGLAAGIAALAALAEEPDLGGSVLFVATPDEENASGGMLAALPGVIALREREGLEYVGALNLDYGPEPALYHGVMGKQLLGAYVRGVTTHAGSPLAGVDAAALAAAIALRATRGEALADAAGPPAALLKLRDMKERYSVQTTLEAVLELNLLVTSRPLAASLEALRAVTREAVAEDSAARARLAQRFPAGGASTDRAVAIHTWPELRARAPDAAPPARTAADSPDPRVRALERVREECRRAGVTGPAVVLYALPPYYPAGAGREGTLARAATAAVGDDVAVRGPYPFITDACYLAWRGEPAAMVAAQMPVAPSASELPEEAARALDLEVVNLGPWGRDAHGLYERVHAPYAFERLPRTLHRLIREVFERS